MQHSAKQDSVLVFVIDKNCLKRNLFDIVFNMFIDVLLREVYLSCFGCTGMPLKTAQVMQIQETG